MSVDAEYFNFPAHSSFEVNLSNPLYYIDPDGKRVKPINQSADNVISSLSFQFGQALQVSWDANTNTYSSSLIFDDFKTFKAALKNEIPKDDLEKAWIFYRALNDPQIIEVLGTQTEKKSADDTRGKGDAGSDGSSVSGNALMTENSEYDEFTQILNKKGQLDEELEGALYSGQTVSQDGIDHSISTDDSGTNWVYFNDSDSTGRDNVKGIVLFNSTDQSNQSQESIVLESLDNVSIQK
jgi:hypothetical protein